MVRTAAGPGCAGQRPQLVRVLRMRVQVPMQIKGRGDASLPGPQSPPAAWVPWHPGLPGPGSWAVGDGAGGLEVVPSPTSGSSGLRESPSALAVLITVDKTLSLGRAALALFAHSLR